MGLGARFMKPVGKEMSLSLTSGWMQRLPFLKAELTSAPTSSSE
jgi:hypothetical protein